jgi:hypothetical protein
MSEHTPRLPGDDLEIGDLGGPLDERTSLYEHVRRLLAAHPDGPLPQQGKPFPDESAYRERWKWTERTHGRAHRDEGVKLRYEQTRAEAPGRIAAAVHQFFSGNPSRSGLVDLCAELVAGYGVSWWELPEMLKPVICEVEPHRVRQLGRWLARHSPDRNPVKVGLALLEETAGSQDINVLQSLAVIGDVFSPAVVRVVERPPGARTGTAVDRAPHPRMGAGLPCRSALRYGRSERSCLASPSRGPARWPQRLLRRQDRHQLRPAYGHRTSRCRR